MTKRKCKKQAYYSENTAVLKLVELWKKVRNKRRKFEERRAYKCSVCGLWHLTSKSEKAE